MPGELVGVVDRVEPVAAHRDDERGNIHIRQRRHDPGAGLALIAAQDDLAKAKVHSRATASHLPLGHVRPGSRLLETERKLITHAIRMSAYNSESALARLLRPHCARSDREGRALAALCTEINNTQTRYPGTDLTVIYSIKGHPSHT